ncbi:MAG: hypothetical protein LBT56_05465 [Prevotellaceae bacterium]|nr:hypothetical protein [Prevotellaceae bacterium]
MFKLFVLLFIVHFFFASPNPSKGGELKGAEVFQGIAAYAAMTGINNAALFIIHYSLLIVHFSLPSFSLIKIKVY